MELLLSKIAARHEGRTATDERVVLPPKLWVRESTVPPRPGSLVVRAAGAAQSAFTERKAQ
jgi:hypothetical protein